MPANVKHYVDQDALEYFLGKLKTAYENGTFSVKYATHAVGDSDTIKNTYATKASLESYVPVTRTIAGLSLGADRSVADINDALGTITDIKLKGNGDASASSLTVTNHSVTIDISDYALKSEVAKVMDYKGADTAANLGAKTAANTNNGEVWSVTTESDLYPTFKSGFEYVAVVSGDPATLSWVELGKNFAGLASETWVTNNFVGNSTYTTDQEAVSDRIDAIYKAGTGGADDTGLLPDEIARATAAEEDLQDAIDAIYLNDNGTESGVLVTKIADAIGALDMASAAGGSGYIITTVNESNGIVSATAEQVVTTIPTGDSTVSNAIPASAAAVKSYVDAAVEAVASDVSGLNLSDVGAVGGYVQVVGQSNGQLSATAGTFDTTIGPASGNGAATDNTAPTSLAVRTLVNDTTVFDAVTGTSPNFVTAGNPIQAMVPLTTTEVDAVFTSVISGE